MKLDKLSPAAQKEVQQINLTAMLMSYASNMGTMRFFYKNADEPSPIAYWSKVIKGSRTFFEKKNKNKRFSEWTIKIAITIQFNSYYY